MAEEADLERLKRGFELYNKGDYDALREFVSPDVVYERAGGLPPLYGWDAMRANLEPDAFESQRVEVLDVTVEGDQVLMCVRSTVVGAGSGLELTLDGWLVWTLEDGLVVRMQTFQDEAEAKRQFGLGQNASP